MSENANGTNAHTKTLTVTTAGAVLYVVMAGASTSTPAGWTVVKTAANNTAVSVFKRTATVTAGEVTTGTVSVLFAQGATNWPLAAVGYEFPSGTTTVGTAGSNTSQARTATSPGLTSLTGTNTVFEARGLKTAAAGTDTFSASWTSPVNKDLDVQLGGGTAVAGVGLTIAYQDGITASSFNPSSTITSNSAITTNEAVSFAVNVPPSTTTTVTNPGSQSGTQGIAITPLGITASNSGSLTLTYTASGLPPGLSINSSTGVISGTPSSGGTFASATVTATATDFSTDSKTFTWTITAAGTTRNVRVAGVATPITARRARVAGVSTVATRKTRVAGVAV